MGTKSKGKSGSRNSGGSGAGVIAAREERQTNESASVLVNQLQEQVIKGDEKQVFNTLLQLEKELPAGTKLYTGMGDMMGGEEFYTLTRGKDWQYLDLPASTPGGDFTGNLLSSINLAQRFTGQAKKYRKKYSFNVK